MKKLSVFLLFVGMCLSSMATTLSSFSSRTDFRDESIYFLMTTRFYDGDPSNNVHCWDAVQAGNEGDPEWRGDFKGVIERLDYIKALGFTAIWVTPIVENASGYDYHGYHASNFSEVDRRYETHTETEDVLFQNLIDAAHARGMKVILDIVLNHTGNFGEENLCKLFTRNWEANQANIDECMVPYTQKNGGKLPDNYLSLAGGLQYAARLAQMKNTDGNNNDKNNYWHHFGSFNWDDDTRWWAQIAGDCVDLNTENQYVANYLVRCYGEFIKMGVDGFRIDTSGHISRLTFNKNFIPQFEALAEEYKAKRNGGDFFMFGEVCARDRNVTYRNRDNLSPYFYTWKETKDYAWDTSETSWNGIVVSEGEKGTHTNVTSVDQQAADYVGEHSDSRTSTNAFLNGNAYHTPDYSQASGFSVIDFPMHWNFRSAQEAWGVKSGDKYYNDATWNVVYVDSHDYAPDGAPEGQRFSLDQATWAENLALIFTFRGIPCIYYGSEIEFQKGKVIDKGPNCPLRETGRAYYGGYMKGTITATDFGEYTATGNVAQTLSHPLAKHIIRLNQIRQAVPALRKGQYSTEGCSGSFAFKRRYTDATTDSYALVCISGNGTFTGIENGTYVDCVTGDTKTVTNNTLTATCSGKGNLRVYVLNTSKTTAPGQIGTDGKYLYNTTQGATNTPEWDGTQDELTDDPGMPGVSTGGGSGSSEEPEEPITPCLGSADQLCAFFNSEGTNITSNVHVHLWGGAGSTTWPGVAATNLGNKMWKVIVPASVGTPTKIIWNSGNGQAQTNDLTYQNHAIYNGEQITGTVTLLCDSDDTPDEPIVDPIEPDEPAQPEEGEACRIYYAGDLATPYIWAWDESPQKNYFSKWPGEAMTAAGEQFEGKALWYYEFTGVLPQQVIFSNNGQSQTANLNTKGCDYVYTGNGWKQLNPATSVETNSIAPMAAKKYWLNGQLVIEREGVRYNVLGNTIE